MSSNIIKVIAAVFVLLAVILGIIAYRMSHSYADNATKAAAQPVPGAAPAAPTVQLVVALKPILANQPIDRASVKVVDIEQDAAPQNYYKDVADVAGRTPLIDVDAGTPLTPRLFKENNLLAKLVPPGFKAVSLTLTDVIGVGGFVRPGDVVDVLVYLRNDSQNKVEPAQARILLRDATVLASDEHIVDPPAGADKNATQQQQQQRRERTVVVSVPDADVTRVMLGANLGEVRLALHGLNPDQNTAAPGVAPAAAAPAEIAAVTPPPAAPAAKVAAAGSAAADQPLPDQPYTSEELGRLKPKKAANAPEGIVIYRGGSKPSTVYP
jgi:pilus assembly protein CpaB